MGGKDLRSDKSNCTVDDFPVHPSELWLPCATVPSLYVNEKEHAWRSLYMTCHVYTYNTTWKYL